MSEKQLYSGGSHSENISHFANIVKLSIADNVLTEGEEKLLKRMVKKLHLSEDEYKKIMENPDSYPFHPPVSYDARIERLYNLTKMVYADGEVSLDEVSLLRRISIGLGFPQDNAEKISDEALHLVMNDNDLEDFTSAIKRVNSI